MSLQPAGICVETHPRTEGLRAVARCEIKQNLLNGTPFISVQYQSKFSLSHGVGLDGSHRINRFNSARASSRKEGIPL